MRALLLLFVLSAFATPAQAKSLQLVGYAGLLGEWELTATVTEDAHGWAKEFSGPLSMKHVGICTQDGPEEKSGEIRLQISALSSRLNATLLVEGVACSYSAGLSDPYSGMMACPDREAVPLKLWLK
ncbi:MAG: hypothetical protein QOI88_759 [Gammaproteobacteria bacterium]|nr:hypothetical protein [Gammaproteobacteria bacterium]